MSLLISLNAALAFVSCNIKHYYQIIPLDIHMITNMNWGPTWARNKSNQKSIVLAFIIFTAIFSVVHLSRVSSNGIGWVGTFHPNKNYEVTGSDGAVASDHPLCSQMGVNILSNGGSAADAAVQVALCLGSVEPQSSGLGGGGFITLRYPNGTALAINCRETAPRKAHKHMFDENPMLSKIGGMASGVPGELAGLKKLFDLASSGNISWHKLFSDVADLNDSGFTKGDGLKHAIEIYEKAAPKNMIDKMIEKSDWCWLFGDRKKCNSKDPNWITRPNLARTLRLIGEEGTDYFYKGPIAKYLSEYADNFNGIIDEDDFANYEVIVSDVLTSNFKGMEVITQPAPASGPAMLMGLNVMENLLNEKLKEMEFNSTVDQQIVETMKWMAAARSELGDTNFISNENIDLMLKSNWTNKVLNHINVNHTLDSWRDYHPSYEMNNPHGTTHFSIIDKNGMAVSMTSTINLPFGNLLCDPETGIILNSEMDDFSIPKNRNSFELAPSVYNFIEPGKRPLSSAVPSIVIDKNGKVDMVVGAAGGSRILTSVFLSLVRSYGFNYTALEAVSFPRYHHQLIPEKLMVEPGFDAKRLNEWESKGHILEPRNPGSALNMVHREGGKWHAVADFYRKRGFGAAYDEHN